MLAKIIMTILAALNGGWMIFEGAHVILYGEYFGPDKPGPWFDLIALVGIDPLRFGGLFILFGLIWIFGIIGLLMKKGWSFELLLAASIGSLWYMPFGTVLSVIFLILLIINKDRLFIR